MFKLRMSIFLIGVFFITSFVFSTEQVKLATGEWYPYTSEKMAGKGFFTEIVTESFKVVDIQPIYIFYPWKRCESELLKGNIFGIFPYVITDERKQQFDFADTVTFSTGRFFYKKSRFKDGIKYDTYDDLKKYVIGGTLGYWYEKPFKEAGLTTEFVPTDEMNYKKLMSGRVDLVVADELVGWDTLKALDKKGALDYATIEKPLNRTEICVMVSRKYPNAQEITKKFNVGLAKIRGNGTYKKILEKYNIKE